MLPLLDEKIFKLVKIRVQKIILNDRGAGRFKNKKHKCIDHCSKFVAEEFKPFHKKWLNVSGIYKITCRPFRFLYYYGSSKNLGARFKYHYYNSPLRAGLLLSILLRYLTWAEFSVTVVELCDSSSLKEREDWYLKKYSPLLNFFHESYIIPVKKSKGLSTETRQKISQSLTGRVVNSETRLKMSLSKKGSLNHQYGKSLPQYSLDAATEKLSTKVWAYDANTFKLVNGTFYPFFFLLKKGREVNEIVQKICQFLIIH